MAKDLENLMEQISSTPTSVNTFEDDGFDDDEAADAALFGITPEEMAGNTKNTAMFFDEKPEKAPSGPILDEAPDPYVVEMFKKSLSGNAKLLTGNKHEACGCFNCKKIFPESRVRVQRKTLFCPYCGQQTVIPSGQGYHVADGIIWRVWAYYRAFGDRTATGSGKK